MSSSPLRLHYYDVAGRADQIRFACEIGKIQYEDIRYSEEKISEAINKSPTKLVPYMELSDGSILVESTAILMYVCKLASETDLIPKCPKSYATAFMIMQSMDNIFSGVEKWYTMNEEEKEKFAISHAPVFMDKMEKLHKAYEMSGQSKSNGKFLFGDHPSFADLHVSTYLKMILVGTPIVKVDMDDFKLKCPMFEQVLRNVPEIPEVKAYLEKHQSKSS